MRAEFPIFPLIFSLTVVVVIVTTFAAVLSIADEIGSPHAGVRSAVAVELFKKADQANRFVETAMLTSTRIAVADRFRTARYPCAMEGRFAVFSADCSPDGDPDRISSDILASVERDVNLQIATHPDALLPPARLNYVDGDGQIFFVARSDEEAVFMLNRRDWGIRGGAIDELFSKEDAPVYTSRVGARAHVEPLVRPLIDTHTEFDYEAVDALVQDALEDDRTYCDDVFSPIVAFERLVDVVESCPVFEDACSCGELSFPDLVEYERRFLFFRTEVDRFNIHLTERSLVLTNHIYDIEHASGHRFEEASFSLDGSEYVVLMNDTNVSLVERSEIGPLPRCRTEDPQITLFSTVPFLFDDHDELFGDHADSITLSSCVAEYQEFRSEPPYVLDDGVVPSCIDGSVSDRDLNLIITTHEDEGSGVRYSGSDVSGVPAIIDALLEREGLYPAPEARLESIVDEFGYFDLDEATSICRARIDDHSILKDPYRVLAEIWPEQEFFREIIEGAPYLIISIPQSFTDECLRERTMAFAPTDPIARSVQERVLSAAVEGAMIHTSAPVSGRLVCLDDPTVHFTHHPFLGYERFEIHPYVIVPDVSDFIWPLEDIGRFTQCWGPPALSWADPPYTYHRGLDLQPTGSRVDRGTIWDRFPDVAVVSAFDGHIVYSQHCPWSPYFDHPEGDGSSAPEDVMFAASSDCSGRDGPFSGGGFGEHLVIESLDGEWLAIYAHLAPGSIWEQYGRPRGLAIPVGHGSAFERGYVSAGQPIGIVGNTGTSTGAHLHFEIYPNDPSRIHGLTKRPLWPAGGYTGDARNYLQFNPFCVLPEEVTLSDGTTYNIADRMPRGATVDPRDPTTAATEEGASEESATFTRPATLVEQCFYNYAMAYRNLNPHPETYGLCP